MMVNETKFYDNIRETLFHGSISSKQLEGLAAILKEYDERKVNDLRKLAYILATAYHETARTMQPIEEYGKGKGRKYGSKVKMNGKPYSTPNKLYYGRGHVQLTWYENYEQFGRVLQLPLLEFPEMALEMSVSIEILFYGMLNGSFTGKKLGDYFTKTLTNWEGARKIINGVDQAASIAGKAKLFYNALTEK